MGDKTHDFDAVKFWKTRIPHSISDYSCFDCFQAFHLDYTEVSFICARHYTCVNKRIKFCRTVMTDCWIRKALKRQQKQLKKGGRNQLMFACKALPYLTQPNKICFCRVKKIENGKAGVRETKRDSHITASKQQGEQDTLLLTQEGWSHSSAQPISGSDDV